MIINEETIHKALMASINEIFKKPKNDILKLGPTAISKKKKFAKQAWNIIQKAYSYLKDGCKSFDPVEGESQEKGNYGFYDFLHGKYIWVLYMNEDGQTINALRIFKPTLYGMKSVCSAANKDVEQGKPSYKNINDRYINNPSMHAYGEMSDAAEHMARKDPKSNFVPVDRVKRILFGKDINTKRNKDYEDETKPRDEFLDGYNYYRKIGDDDHRKIMVGHPINK